LLPWEENKEAEKVLLFRLNFMKIKKNLSMKMQKNIQHYILDVEQAFCL
jgi:hypothetical protein